MSYVRREVIGRSVLMLCDCRDGMASLDADSVDSIVCDPPYGLKFMGKGWDRGVPGVEFWTAALRVAKPGAHLLAFGGTRTFHRLACAIEDAGWEIRDTVMYVYGSGFPKSARVNRDPRFCQCGASARSDENKDREQQPPVRSDKGPDVGDDVRSLGDARHSTHGGKGSQAGCHLEGGLDGEQPRPASMGDLVFPPSRGDVQGRIRSASLSDDLGGELICNPFPARCTDRLSSLDSTPRDFPESAAGVRKLESKSPSDTCELENHTQDTGQGLSCGEYGIGFPLCKECGKTIADGWGTALKPAWEPVIMARKPLIGTVAKNVLKFGTGSINVNACRVPSASGELDSRWPANLIHDGSEEVLACFPPDRPSGGHVSHRNVPKSKNAFGDLGTPAEEFVGYPDTGSAARFFYTAKASRADRNEDCEGEEDYEHSGPRGHSLNGDGSPRPRPRPRPNTHPTVKPTDLMRYLCRLVTPPGGIVLDPFMGSGSTGKAAEREGFRFIGMELEPEHFEVALRRIENAARQNRLFA